MYLAAFASLRARIVRFQQTGDTAPLLSQQSFAEVRTLLGSIDHWRADPEVFRVLVFYMWSRYLLLQDKPDHLQHALGELAPAVIALRPIYEANPGMLPKELHQLFDLSALWTRQGVATMARYDATGDLSALNESVDHMTRAVEAIRIDDPSHARYVANLGSTRFVRFNHTGDIVDLNAAIELLREAINYLSSGTRAQEAAGIQSNLSAALQARFERLSQIANLDDAIRCAGHAVDLTERGDSGAGKYLTNLSTALLRRFEYSGEQADLDAAINNAKASLELVSNDPLQRAVAQANLGTMLGTRFRHKGSPADLDAGIAYLRAGVADTPPHHPNRATYQSNLSGLLNKRFKRDGSHADFKDDATPGQWLVDLTGIDHPDRGRHLTNQANRLIDSFERTGDPLELDRAIDIHREAVAVTQIDRYYRVTVLSNLGSALDTRYNSRHIRRDAEEAMAVYREAADTADGAPLIRIKAARRCGQIATKLADWEQAIGAMTTAVRLLPQLASREQTREDQEYWLSEVDGLASEAAACALEAGDTALAVSLLEQSRGLLFSYARKAHEPHREELAHRLASLSDPPAVADLLPAPGEPPIVLVNIARLRCDAICLTSHGLRLIHLDWLTADAATDACIPFMLGLAAIGSPDAPTEILEHGQTLVQATLNWLWDTIAAPVLESLGFRDRPTPGRPWPRIRWILTRPLNWLPVHAAGHHDQRDEIRPPTVMDRVVSSYAPTISAARQVRTQATAPQSPRMLAVVMPDTPGGFQPLHSASAEAELIRRLFMDAFVLTGRQAERRRVLAHLPSHSYVHFACHSASSLESPSSSRLLLHDHANQPLTVQDISGLKLNEGWLAFLSTCSTAQTEMVTLVGQVARGKMPSKQAYRSLQLTDESLHLAAAFQVAGYSHVIGTLWPVDDVAAEIAEHFYRELRNHDPAAALHRATQRMRHDYPNLPSVWASHIHIGA
jgi:tetratricopeptide (TPR) repeat protein